MKKKIILLIISLIMIASHGFSQGRLYEGPEDPAGDKTAIREGYMNGNRVMVYFDNNGTIGDMSKVNGSKWPNTYNGLRMMDQINLTIGAVVYLHNDSIPITDRALLSTLPANEIDTLYFLQSTGSMLHQDKNYYETVNWSFYPPVGYMNEGQDYAAMSNKPDSWPTVGWPSTGYEKKWIGEWNGRFGRGITYADLETYAVFNDAQDQEYIISRNDPEEKLRTGNEPRYYPRPGVYIGTHPGGAAYDVTTQEGLPWGGMGIRVEQRGFQWNNPEAKDMVFFEYNIANISDYDLTNCAFGYRMDLAVGNEHGPDDDKGYFNDDLDMAYAWDWDGVGQGGFTPGTLGLAYLESPGRPYDDVDNDNDGLLNEKRDNPAGALIGPNDGIADLQKFLDFYALQESDLREHFEGDEDQDWIDGIDLNGDGDYSYYDEDKQLWFIDEGEIAGDDVGLDGVGPMDLNYNGPDEGEGNHRPDYIEGIGCEPNFAITDVSESDMLGLTTFRMIDMAPYTSGELHAYNDENVWNFMTQRTFEEFLYENPVTLFFTFSSSKFPLYKGRTERISIAMLNAYENFQYLNSATHEAPNLFSLKKTAQIIYERDYRFAQPPSLPTLTAKPGDGKVYLSWNDVADQHTREAFLNNINDFEGYKLYRATDKLMSDAEVITDGKGTPMFKSPIYQCDLINNITGYADYGMVAGTQYYLGDDTGIKHYFVDEDVQNGRTYYYALVAYDYGHPTIVDGGLSPTENNIIIELNEAEEVIRTGVNVQIVTPGTYAAGYEEPGVNVVNKDQLIGNCLPTFKIFDGNNIKPGHQYALYFDIKNLAYFEANPALRNPKDGYFVNVGYHIIDETDSNAYVYGETVDNFSGVNITENTTEFISNGTTRKNTFDRLTDTEIISDVFDGVQMTLKNLVDVAELDLANTGWLAGEAPLDIKYGNNASAFYPWNYEIVFTDDAVAYSTKSSLQLNQYDGDGEQVLKKNILWNGDFNFYVREKTFSDTSGYEILDLLRTDRDGDGLFDPLVDEILVGYVKQAMGKGVFGGTIFSISFKNCEESVEYPIAGDVYRIDFKRPYYYSDTLRFTVESQPLLDEKQLNDDMKEIKVVPNPYICTNSMETAVGNKYLNQRRAIMFTHIPADCDIRIFTSSGYLVKTLEVTNEPANGIVHWNLLTKEDLEVAAGMYVYHVKSKVTGKEKIGKFAIIK